VGCKLCGAAAHLQFEGEQFMTWKGLGKVTVATAGTPVSLATLIPAADAKFFALKVTYDAADTGTALVKDRSGNVMAQMVAATAQPVDFVGSGSNCLNSVDFQIDSSVNGKGPIVSYAVG
jgi:hypothetical protein